MSVSVNEYGCMIDWVACLFLSLLLSLFLFMSREKKEVAAHLLVLF